MKRQMITFITKPVKKIDRFKDFYCIFLLQNSEFLSIRSIYKHNEIIKTFGWKIYLKVGKN